MGMFLPSMKKLQDACMKERITAQAVQPRLKVSSKIDMFFSAFAEKHAGLLRAMTNATRVTLSVGKKRGLLACYPFRTPQLDTAGRSVSQRNHSADGAVHTQRAHGNTRRSSNEHITASQHGRWNINSWRRNSPQRFHSKTSCDQPSSAARSKRPAADQRAWPECSTWRWRADTFPRTPRSEIFGDTFKLIGTLYIRWRSEKRRKSL